MNVMVPLAEGFEELEAVTVIDTLRRAGWTVAAAGLAAGPVPGSHGIGLQPDILLDEVDVKDFDMIVLPGGMPGTERLCDDRRVHTLLQALHAAQRWIGAICAAPLVLHHAGILKKRRYTCYPGLEQRIATGIHESHEVVVDGHLVTSRGPGTALPFALTLVGRVAGSFAARELAGQMLVPWQGEELPSV